MEKVYEGRQIERREMEKWKPHPPFFKTSASGETEL